MPRSPFRFLRHWKVDFLQFIGDIGYVPTHSWCVRLHRLKTGVGFVGLSLHLSSSKSGESSMLTEGRIQVVWGFSPL